MADLTTEIASRILALTIGNREQSSELHVAASRGHHESLAALLAVRNSQVNQKRTLDVESVDDKDDAGLTALHHASASESLDCVKHLLKADASADEQDEFGWTPLHFAAAMGNRKIAELLIEKAKPDAVNYDGHDTPMHIAARHLNTKVICALLKKHSGSLNMRNRDDNNPLHLAIKNGGTENVCKHLCTPSSTKSRVRGAPPLLLVCARSTDDPDMVRLLLAQGADVDGAVAGLGLTPLMAAARLGHLQMMKVLLNSGAQCEAVDKVRFTALHHAVLSNQRAAAQLLLESRANVDARDVAGNTPFLVAAAMEEQDVSEVAELLVSYGADLHAHNSRGYDARALAQAFGNTEFVEKFL